MIRKVKLKGSREMIVPYTSILYIDLSIHMFVVVIHWYLYIVCNIMTSVFGDSVQMYGIAQRRKLMNRRKMLSWQGN